MCPCCWPPTAGGWPSGTGIWMWGRCGSGTQRNSSPAYLACWAGLLDRPEPVRPRELVEEFSWKRVPREDIRLDGNEIYLAV